MKNFKKFEFFVNRIFSIFLVFVASVGFIFLFTKAAIGQITLSSTSQIANLPPEPNAVYNALKLLNQNEYSKAMAVIEEKIFYESSIDVAIRDYFEALHKYISNMINPYNSQNYCEFDTSYFILNAPFLMEYLQKECHYSKSAAKMLSEIPPYFFIKNYDQSFGNKSRLYKLYIDTFGEENNLSEKTANVLCLYFQSLYAENKMNAVALKIEISSIQEYCNVLFSYELGENGIYLNQRIFLKNLQSYLIKVSNKKIMWLNMENPPNFVL